MTPRSKSNAATPDRLAPRIAYPPFWSTGAGMNAFQAAALAYAMAGWPVLPVIANRRCRSGGSSHAASRTPGPTPNSCGEWWRIYPWANIGFPTGDGIAVLDVDSYKGGSSTGRGRPR